MQDRKFLFGLSSITLVIIAGAAAKFILHMATGSNYGFFCDELYTIALSKHLALGYVDLPPLAPALVAFSRFLFGESLPALHIFPALAGSATLVFACLIAKEFGGKVLAVSLCALGFLITPVWLILDSFFCYDSIDQFVLAGFLYVLVRFIRTGDRKLWLLMGLIAGIACMTKMTILYLGPGFLVALLVSKYRRDLLTPWPWLGGGLFLAVVSPYLLWENANQWPTLEYWANYSSNMLFHYSIPEYFVNILLITNPLLFPLLAIGLYRIFRDLDDVNYSHLGIMFLVTLVLVFFLHARSFMLAELFIPLLAAGAVFVEERIAVTGREKGLKTAAVAWMLAGGILVAPASLPLLPMELLPAYAKSFGFLYQPVKDFKFAKSDYPQEFSNRIGWDDLVRTVAEVYDELPPEERKIAGVWADWYGPAGAIDLLGPQYGLPHAVSGHLTYYLWGPGYSWDVMIVVTGNIQGLSSFFEGCEMKAAVLNEYAMPWNHPFIYVCKKPKMPPDEIWMHLKNY